MVFTIHALIGIRTIATFDERLDLAHKRHSTITQAISLIERSEALQSRYLLTNNPKFLSAYEEHIQRLPKAESDLLALTSSTPLQHRNALDLSGALSERVAMMNRSIDIFQHQGLETARAGVASNGSFALMQRITDISNNMHTQEAAVQVESAERDQRTAVRAVWSTAIAGACGMCLVCLVVLVMGREMISTRRAELAFRLLHEEKSRVNAELEERVRQRTAALELSEQELKAAKEAAEAANVEKSRFLASMSHELRTPLNAIIGFSEMLQDGNYGPVTEKQQRQLGHVVSGGRHLLSLINDILDISKVEAGKMELDLASFDPTAVIHETEESVLALANAKDISLTTSIADVPDHITADRLKFKQMLYNLLSNAIKFTPNGGSVDVNITADAQSLTTKVTDTGIGIATENIGRLFRNFEQIKSSYGVNQQGTGLGLALALKLAELHGGTVTAESPGEGEGSCFTLTIPLNQPAESNQTPVEALRAAA
jgi:signal transduction histidine kinase